MSEIYGFLWVKCYGKKPIKLWVRALAKFNDDEIKQGLARCLSRKDEAGRIDKFPPNLAEFVQICTPDITRACHRVFILLPRPKINHEFAKQAIKEMRKSIRGCE